MSTRALLITLLFLSSCADDPEIKIGVPCGEGTPTVYDCPGTCISVQCEDLTVVQERFTCSDICVDDTDCGDPDAFCYFLTADSFSGFCLRRCTTDDDCLDRTHCASDGSCVRDDPPPMLCTAG